MEQFNAYVDQVCSKIRWKKVRPLVREELLGHLEESSGERESEGMGAAESAEEAVSAMGDATLTGAKLNALYKPRVVIVMIVAFALLALAAFFVMPPGRWIAGCAGVVLACVGCAVVDVRKRLSKYGMYIFIAGLVALFAVLAFAPQMNGRKMLPVLEFAGVFLCVCGMGAFLGGTKNASGRAFLGIVTAFVTLAGGLVLALPHFWMLVMMGVSFWAVFLKSGMPRYFVWALLGAVVIFGCLWMMQAQYRLDRLWAHFAFIFNDQQDVHGAGYVNGIIRDVWRNAQWFGPSSTPGMEREMDMIGHFYPLTKIVMLFGRIPAYLLIAANITMCGRMLSLSRKLKDALSSCVAFGLSVLVTIMTALSLLSCGGVYFAYFETLFLTPSGAYWLLQGMSVALVFALNFNRDYIRLEHGGKMREMQAKKAPL